MFLFLFFICAVSSNLGTLLKVFLAFQLVNLVKNKINVNPK